ncbi:hypothetical protein D3C87_1097040 [compost metagenome]
MADLLFKLQAGVEFQGLNARLAVIGDLPVVVGIGLTAILANEDFTPPLVVLAAHVECGPGNGEVSGGVVLGDLFRGSDEFIERLRRIGSVQTRLGEELLVVE